MQQNVENGANRQAFNVTYNEPAQIKNPQLVKIYGDLQKKSILVGFWVNFFVITIIIYLLTISVPSALFSRESYILNCPDSVNKHYPDICFQISSATPQNMAYWIGFANDMSPLNQILILAVTFIRNNTILGNKELSIPVNVSLAMLTSSSSDNYYPIYNNTQTLKIDCLDATSNECTQKYLAYVSEIDQSNYFFLADFSNNSPPLDSWAINYSMKFLSINPEYSKFLLGTRYAFVILSLIFNYLYIKKIRKIPLSDVVIEQKFIFVLGCLLTLFNDPFAGLTVLYPNVASGFFAMFFNVNFACVILLFWLVVFDRIFKENDRKENETLNLSKFLFIALIWIFLLIPYVLLSVMAVSNPLVGINEGVNKAYDVFKYIGLVLIGFYCGFLLNYYIKICKVYNSRLWRHKTLFTFSNYFIFALFLFIFTGSLNANSQNGQELFMVVAILNMYIYFMQFLYCPTSEGIKESSQFINNEKALRYNAFDILDDKEEDINIDFEQNPKEIEIQEVSQQHPYIQNEQENKKEVGMIEFDKSQSVEDLNESKDKNSHKDIFI